jgi:hypothetical protein
MKPLMKIWIQIRGHQLRKNRKRNQEIFSFSSFFGIIATYVDPETLEIKEILKTDEHHFLRALVFGLVNLILFLPRSIRSSEA